jgi:hypothetical protein
MFVDLTPNCTCTKVNNQNTTYFPREDPETRKNVTRRGFPGEVLRTISDPHYIPISSRVVLGTGVK